MSESRKDELDCQVADAVGKCEEWCCGEYPVPAELMGKPQMGMMAVRVRCPVCNRTWGLGIGSDFFFREEDL